MAKKKYKGISDSNLQDYWRKAVRKKYNYRCIFTGRTTNLECHHIHKRRHLLTRHDHRNGVLVNNDPATFFIGGKELQMTPHQYAETRQGVNLIIDLIGQEVYDELEALSRTVGKDYFLQEGITRNEFLQRTKDDLVLFIKA